MTKVKFNYNFVWKKTGLTRSHKNAKIRLSAEMCQRKFIHTYGIKLLLSTFLLRAYLFYRKICFMGNLKHADLSRNMLWTLSANIQNKVLDP